MTAPEPASSGFTVTVEADPFDSGEVTAFEVVFHWDGESTNATFALDLSDTEDLSLGSSSPAQGWVSWAKRPTLALAWEHPERDEARASTVEVDELSEGTELTEADWEAIARAITLDVMSDAASTSKSVYLGQVEVDSGTLLVADPVYVLPNAEQGRTGIDYTVLTSMAGAVTPVAGGMGLLLANFGGDGSFPAFGEIEDGEMWKLTVLFVDPSEDDE